VAAEIDAGTVWVNQHLALTHRAPFGGTCVVHILKR